MADQGSLLSTATLQIVPAVPLVNGFDYLAPPGDPPRRGSIVMVPLGQRLVPGIVLGPGSGEVPQHKLKAVTSVARLAPLEPAFVDFIEKMASWTMAPLGSIAKVVRSQPKALLPPPLQTVYRLPDQLPDHTKLTKARQRVVALLQDVGSLPSPDIQKLAGVSGSVITTMAQQGLLQSEQIAADPPVMLPRLDIDGAELTEDQEAAAAVLRAAIGNGYNAFLLDGVTGSGKTEVYFEAVRTALARDQQILILLFRLFFTHTVNLLPTKTPMLFTFPLLTLLEKTTP